MKLRAVTPSAKAMGMPENIISKVTTAYEIPTTGSDTPVSKGVGGRCQNSSAPVHTMATMSAVFERSATCMATCKASNAMPVVSRL